MDQVESLDVIAGLQQVEEDRLIHTPLAEFEVIPVDRRFGTVLFGDIAPGTPGDQDVEDAVQELSGIAPGPAGVGFLGRQMLPNNFPEIVVDFLEGHDRG